MSHLLQVSHLSKWFGGNPVLQDIGFTIEAGEIVGLIGPNGAGKTTLFNVITGFLRPRKGSRLVFDGREIAGLKPETCPAGDCAARFRSPSPSPTSRSWRT